jgi:hypothetical protein
MSWSIQDLKSIILDMFNEAQVELARAPLESIFQNQDFSRYHYTELERLIGLHLDDISTEKDYFHLVITNDLDVLNKEDEFKTACKANIMAFLRSIHCNTDLLAHAIYYSLGLNLNEKTKLSLKYLNFKKVKDKLSEINGSESLIEALDKFTNHHNYTYLNGLVNHTKHRANITSNLNYAIAKTGKDVYKFYFPPFEYEEEKYEKKSVYSFLHNEFDRQSEQIIEIGNKINILAEHANKAFKRN